MPSALRIEGQSAIDIRAAIESFLKSCRRPALLEPGEELLAINGDNLTIEPRGSRLTLEAWDRNRVLNRRVLSVRRSSPGRLELAVGRFGQREGSLFLIDLDRPTGAELARRSGKLVFRERFRLFLRRQFPEWKLVEVSADANLEFSLSPAYPRAFLRHGNYGWAAIACPPEADPNGLLTFGLIWLGYLRAREQRVALQGLALYVPYGAHQNTALRLLCLDPRRGRLELFGYSPDDMVSAIDPRDAGNLDTRLEACRRPDPNQEETWRHLTELPGVECVPKHDGTSSLRVRGLEFAQLGVNGLRFGMNEKRAAALHHVGEIERLVEELDFARSEESSDRDHPLFRQFPEAWLESQVRHHLETVDASLLSEPVYDQVPAFAGGERGILDLLAVDGSGRLAVLELKASADPQLPLQALDYWLRVKWHLDRREFSAHGYFPGIELRSEPPRLLLVAPSLEFHPSTEVILSYFSPEVPVERVGLGMDWRKGLQVMFRFTGADRPD